MIICNANVLDPIPNLIPVFTSRGNRKIVAKNPIASTRHQEPAEEIEIVNISRPFWYRSSNSADESNNVDQNAAYVGCIAAPMEPKGKIIGRRFAGGIKVSHLVIAAADDVVVAYHNARNRGEKYGVGAEVSGKIIRGREEIPI